MKTLLHDMLAALLNTDTVMPKPAKEENFETKLLELEQLVKQLEDSQLPLAESMAAFERGVELSRHCQNMLEQAQLRVQTLMDTAESDESNTE